MDQNMANSIRGHKAAINIAFIKIVPTVLYHRTLKSVIVPTLNNYESGPTPSSKSWKDALLRTTITAVFMNYPIKMAIMV